MSSANPHPCVLQERANEPKRRAAMERRRQEKKAAHVGIDKGHAYGRILTEVYGGGRIVSFHATKGWRNRRDLGQLTRGRRAQRDKAAKAAREAEQNEKEVQRGAS